MAKKNNEKSQAEIYREERKERIAKANKKNAKGISAGKAAANVGKKIVAIILVAAIVFGAGYYLVTMTGLTHSFTTAMKVGDTKISTAMYNFYYNTVYNNTIQMAQMYQQYGMDIGFDTSVSPDLQVTQDEDGNEITYAEAFRTAAITRAKTVESTYATAMKEGFELDEETKAEMNETLESFKSSAQENGFSVNSYLKAYYGAGFKYKDLEKQLEKEYVVEYYNTKKQEELKAAVTTEEIEKEYKENSKNYDYVDISYYVFTATTLTANDGETEAQLKERQDKKNAELYKEVKEIAGKVKDTDSFEKEVKAYKKVDEDKKDEKDEEKLVTSEKHFTYSEIVNTMNETVADWVYDAKTKQGDVKDFNDGEKAYIVVINKTAYNGYSVDVRHCLVKFNEADEGNPTDEEKAAAKKKTDELLAEWKKGDKTEATFEVMVKENTEDEGSAETGGLYEDVRYSSNYVENFLEWAMDSKRTQGETGIVETEYGYHIMYFVGADKEDTDYADTIRSNKGDDAYQAFAKSIEDDEAYTVESSDFWTNHVSKEFCKKIKRSAAYSASNG